MAGQITKKEFDAFVDGDESVFADIFNQNQRKVFTFIFKMVKSRPDAEEITCDVFCKLWSNRANIESHQKFYGYLYKSAVNASLNFLTRYRDNSRETLDKLPDIEFSGSIESDYQAMEMRLQIDLAVENMPPQRKKIFILSREKGLTNTEIADELGLSRKTVHEHLKLALDEVRKYIHTTLFFWF